MKKLSLVALALVLCLVLLTGCTLDSAGIDRQKTLDIGNTLASNQPTPTDITASLERYNLIRRTYWVNGQKEKSMLVPAPLPNIPLAYVVLFTNSGGVVGRFVVEGKVSSLLNYLTPVSEWYETSGNRNDWLPDTDGSFGDNNDGIFFFTPTGNYFEWNGIYLYSDTPIDIEAPISYYEVTSK
jgi:predicted small secreted protein